MKLPEPEISRRRFLGSLALAAVPLLQSPPGEENVPPPVDRIHALQSSIYGPTGLCFDAHDNLLIVDSLHCRVRKVDAKTRIITTLAGDGRYRFAGDNGLATRASLQGPECAQVDAEGNVYISDYLTDRIRKIDAATGIITTIAGRDVQIWDDKSKEGDAATRRTLDRPNHMAFDSKGALYGLEASRLFRIDKNGAMTTIAGKRNFRSFTGDGGPSSAATLQWPQGLAIDRNGNIFISDTDNYRIRRIDGRTGRISSIYAVQKPYTRESRGVIAMYAGVSVRDLAIHAEQLYFVASNSVNVMNLKSTAVTEVLALDASFGGISGMALDRLGNLHVSDWLGNKVWKVDLLTQSLTLVAGNGLPKHPPRAHG